MAERIITVLGKLKDTKEYIGKDGYNVLAESDGWTQRLNAEWLLEAVKRGDKFLIVSTELTGMFEKEVYRLVILMWGISNKTQSDDI